MAGNERRLQEISELYQRISFGLSYEITNVFVQDYFKGVGKYSEGTQYTVITSSRGVICTHARSPRIK